MIDEADRGLIDRLLSPSPPLGSPKMMACAPAEMPRTAPDAVSLPRATAHSEDDPSAAARAKADGRSLLRP